MQAILSCCVFHCLTGTFPLCKTANLLKSEMVIWTHFFFLFFVFFFLCYHDSNVLCVYTRCFSIVTTEVNIISQTTTHSSFVLDSISAMLVCSNVDDKASNTSIPLFHLSPPVLGGSRRQSLLLCVCVCVCVCTFGAHFIWVCVCAEVHVRAASDPF